MEIFKQYYRGSTIFLGLAVLAGALIGWFQGGGIGAALNAAFAVLILSVLEASLSFDNAVLNAKELDTMSDKHRNWFMTWGILIAVVGMRLIFPILIVSVVGMMNPIHAFWIAITAPKEYAHVLESSGIYVSAFGGAFLLMVSLNFFLNKDKEDHWLPWFETPLVKLAQLQEVLVLMIICLTALEVPTEQRFVYVVSGCLGLALYLAVSYLKDFVQEHRPESAQGINAAVSGGIASLIYLEILDASMSFDGVIGAFAVTSEIFVVMLGLGVGAAYVRSMTIQLVREKTLSQFRYLEHGAQWAIGALAAIMFIKVAHHVPEVVTGLVGAFIIGAAVWHSHVMNKRDALNPPVEAETVA